MNSFILTKIISVIIASVSQIFLKKNAIKEHNSVIKEYINPSNLITYSVFCISTLLGIYSLKGISISLSAVIESLSYIIIPILSFIFLNEKQNRTQIIGLLLIVIGIIVFNC